MGYFLQPIYVEKLVKKIYLYDELVKKMLTEFRERLIAKRAAIGRTKQVFKEYSLQQVTMICQRCREDIAPLKTFNYEHHDRHLAKCVFGTLYRVEIEDAQTNPLYIKDRDFIDLHVDTEFRSSSIPSTEYINAVPKTLEQLKEKYAFARCKNNHVLGII